MSKLRTIYRTARVKIRQLFGAEPYIPVKVKLQLEFHGNDYCGWAIPQNFLNSSSVIVDVGVGEDISFTQSLIEKYGCKAEGFDPTPRAAEFIAKLAPEQFSLHRYGLADRSGKAVFNLPTNQEFVSGSVVAAEHLEGQKIEVELVDFAGLLTKIGTDKIDILKIDIEGSEYDLLDSASFMENAGNVRAICIEFHHRWNEFGASKTDHAVKRLNQLGFRCAWSSVTTNEEFLFVR